MTTPKTQYAILGLLNLFGASSGYQLKKVMAESTEHLWSEGFGSIYPTLQSLENQGLVIKNGIEGIGKRKSNIYAITARGKGVLNKWLGLDPEERKPRNELLLKIFFIRDQPISQIRRLLERHRSQIEEKLTVFELIKVNLLKNETDNPALPYWLMTLRHGMLHAHASIDWCNECLVALKN